MRRRVLRYGRDQDGALVQATVTFLTNRLQERSTIEWAVALHPNRTAEREAIRQLLSFKGSPRNEPYRSAWLWILESWDGPAIDDDLERYNIEQQVRAGNITPKVLRSVVNLVRPFPKVEKLSEWGLYGSKPPPRKPTMLEHLVRLRISGGLPITLDKLGFSKTINADVLGELVERLDATILEGLRTAQRLNKAPSGWDVASSQVKRVYWVPANELETGENEPDAFRSGFAASVKMLFEAVSYIVDLELETARRFVAPFRDRQWQLYRRLWAAFARDPRLVDPHEVASFLIGLNDDEFWSIPRCPEVAEMRSLRFNELPQDVRKGIEQRICSLPPSAQWPSTLSAKERLLYQRRRAYTELRRIEAGGGALSRQTLRRIAQWESSIQDVPQVDGVTFGFSAGPSVRWRGAPDIEFEAGGPAGLIERLEAALTSDDWSDASSAADRFIRENQGEVIAALEDRTDKGANAPNVWMRLSRAHRSTMGNAKSKRDKNAHQIEIDQAQRIVRIVHSLPEETWSHSIDGFATWMNEWSPSVGEDPSFSQLWQRLWPIAVDATNGRYASNSEEDELENLLNNNQKDLGENLAQEAINTPVGDLVSAFLKLCPSRKKTRRPFSPGPLRTMRDSLLHSAGEARLQVLHRLLQEANYFFLGRQI
jgi:hypothetical protein